MAIDLSGGLPAQREYFLREAPGIPNLRDSASFWLFDDRGGPAFPRVCIDAGHPAWDTPEVQVNVGLGDGRVLRVWEPFPRRDDAVAKAPEEAPAVLAAGPLAFRCVEPFGVWTSTFRGTALETTTEALMSGEPGGREVELEFHVEARMAAPPWVMGAMSAKASEQLSGADGVVMGGARYEQLFRGAGVLRLDGVEHAFAGPGTRVRRVGVRNMQGYPGHCMANALFPSGRGFGYMAFGDADQGATYSEAFVYAGDGALRPARVLRAPWMSALRARDDDVSVVLESDLGVIEIVGATYATTFDLETAEIAGDMVLHQGGARYTWGGETTYGVIERATPRAKLHSIPS